MIHPETADKEIRNTLCRILVDTVRERFFAGHHCKAFQKFRCLDVEEESEQEEDEEGDLEETRGQQPQ